MADDPFEGRDPAEMTVREKKQILELRNKIAKAEKKAADHEELVMRGMIHLEIEEHVHEAVKNEEAVMRGQVRAAVAGTKLEKRAYLRVHVTKAEERMEVVHEERVRALLEELAAQEWRQQDGHAGMQALRDENAALETTVGTLRERSKQEKDYYQFELEAKTSQDAQLIQQLEARSEKDMQAAVYNAEQRTLSNESAVMRKEMQARVLQIEEREAELKKEIQEDHAREHDLIIMNSALKSKIEATDAQGKDGIALMKREAEQEEETLNLKMQEAMKAMELNEENKHAALLFEYKGLESHAEQRAAQLEAARLKDELAATEARIEHRAEKAEQKAQDEARTRISFAESSMDRHGKILRTEVKVACAITQNKMRAHEERIDQEMRDAIVDAEQRSEIREKMLKDEAQSRVASLESQSARAMQKQVDEERAAVASAERGLREKDAEEAQMIIDALKLELKQNELKAEESLQEAAAAEKKRMDSHEDYIVAEMNVKMKTAEQQAMHRETLLEQEMRDKTDELEENARQHSANTESLREEMTSMMNNAETRGKQQEAQAYQILMEREREAAKQRLEDALLREEQDLDRREEILQLKLASEMQSEAQRAERQEMVQIAAMERREKQRDLVVQQLEERERSMKSMMRWTLEMEVNTAVRETMKTETRGLEQMEHKALDEKLDKYKEEQRQENLRVCGEYRDRAKLLAEEAGRSYQEARKSEKIVERMVYQYENAAWLEQEAKTLRGQAAAAFDEAVRMVDTGNREEHRLKIMQEETRRLREEAQKAIDDAEATRARYEAREKLLVAPAQAEAIEGEAEGEEVSSAAAEAPPAEAGGINSEGDSTRELEELARRTRAEARLSVEKAMDSSSPWSLGAKEMVTEPEAEEGAALESDANRQAERRQSRRSQASTERRLRSREVDGGGNGRGTADEKRRSHLSPDKAGSASPSQSRRSRTASHGSRRSRRSRQQNRGSFLSPPSSDRSGSRGSNGSKRSPQKDSASGQSVPKAAADNDAPSADATEASRDAPLRHEKVDAENAPDPVGDADKTVKEAAAGTEPSNAGDDNSPKEASKDAAGETAAEQKVPPADKDADAKSPEPSASGSPAETSPAPEPEAAATAPNQTASAAEPKLEAEPEPAQAPEPGSERRKSGPDPEPGPVLEPTPGQTSGPDPEPGLETAGEEQPGSQLGSQPSPGPSPESGTGSEPANATGTATKRTSMLTPPPRASVAGSRSSVATSGGGRSSLLAGRASLAERREKRRSQQQQQLRAKPVEVEERPQLPGQRASAVVVFEPGDLEGAFEGWSPPAPKEPTSSEPEAEKGQLRGSLVPRGSLVSHAFHTGERGSVSRRSEVKPRPTPQMKSKVMSVDALSKPSARNPFGSGNQRGTTKSSNRDSTRT